MLLVLVLVLIVAGVLVLDCGLDLRLGFGLDDVVRPLQQSDEVGDRSVSPRRDGSMLAASSRRADSLPEPAHSANAFRESFAAEQTRCR